MHRRSSTWKESRHKVSTEDIASCWQQDIQMLQMWCDFRELAVTKCSHENARRVHARQYGMKWMILHDSNYMFSIYYIAILRSRRRHTRLKSKRTMNRCQNCGQKHWNTTYLLSNQRLKLTSRVHLRLLNGLSLKPLAGKEMFRKILCFIL